MNNIIFQTETIKDRSQKIKVKYKDAVLKILDAFHYPCIVADELKILIRNVI